MSSNDEALSIPLQESVLTLLATNSKQGRIAAGLVKAESFDDSFREIATRILAYHRKHKKAPGVEHLDDVFDDIIANAQHKKQRLYTRMLEGIIDNAEGLNAEYVLSRVNEFSRRQSLKAAVIEASERYQQGGDDLVANVETILTKALRFKEQDMDAGVFLSDRKRALQFLHKSAESWCTGIDAFDRIDLGPTRGKMLLFMAPKGTGKSWWCIDAGKRLLLQGARVVHITLEMPIEDVIQRYFQSFFAIPKRKEPIRYTRFALDRLGRLEEFVKKKRNPKMSIKDPKLERWLSKRINQWGARFDRLVVQSFPTKSLTIAKLNAYLDMLEFNRFIPDALILDYPDLMWMDKNNPRISIGWTYEELRGILQQRNMAGIFPTQGNRKSWDASVVKGSMVAEDASKFMTADMAVIYSQTLEEKARKLARLFVEKHRSDEDKFTVLISQSYESGQFVLDSIRMPQNYWSMIGDKAKPDDEEE